MAAVHAAAAAIPLSRSSLAAFHTIDANLAHDDSHRGTRALPLPRRSRPRLSAHYHGCSRTQPPQRLLRRPHIPRASYHPDVPLAPAPSFSLHHRQHHLNKFLASPLGSALLLNKLRSGAIFLKHGQRGLPHYRYVWVKEDEGGRDRVCWAELRRRDKVRGWMDVKGLLRVEEGHGAGGVFGRSRGSDPRRCFSVVGEDRSLDLECISEEDREMWVIAFAFLIEHTRRSGNSSGTVGVDVAGIAPSLSLVSALELLCEQNHTMTQSKQSSTSSALSQQDDEHREGAVFHCYDRRVVVLLHSRATPAVVRLRETGITSAIHCWPTSSSSQRPTTSLPRRKYASHTSTASR